MSSGFGAGFFVLSVLAVLGAVALGLAGLGVAAVVLDRRRGRVPTPLWSLAAVLLAAVLAVAGFAVALLVDESPPGAVLVAALTVLPVAAAAARARWRGAGLLASATTAAIAWSLPFVAAAALQFALLANGVRFEVATPVAAAVAVGGTLLAGERLHEVVAGAD